MKKSFTIPTFALLAAIGACNSRVLVVADEQGADASSDAGAQIAQADAGPDDAASAPQSSPDGFAPPQGTLLATGDPQDGVMYLLGITTDDYAVYGIDTATFPEVTTEYAVSLAGGPVYPLQTPDGGAPGLAVMGNVLVGLDSSQAAGPVQADGVVAGPATIWSHASGPSAPLGSAVVFSVDPPPPAGVRRAASEITVSSDGSRVAYFDDFDPASSTANLYVAGTDGTGATRLASSIHVAGDTCVPALAWGGDSLVTAYCTGANVPDAGSYDEEPDGSIDAAVFVASGEGGSGAPLVATVTSFGPSGTPVTIASGVAPAFAVDPAGTTVVVASAAGLLAYPIGGGTPVTLDAAGAVGGVPGAPSVGLFTPDGTRFVYTTASGALRVTATSGATSPLALSGDGAFYDLAAVSPDGEWVTGSSTWSYPPAPGTGPNTNLSLASTSGASGATPLITGDESFLGDMTFTADSSHLVYGDDLASSGTMSLALGPDAGAPTVYPGRYWGTVFPTSGAKIVMDYGSGSIPDIAAVDLATGAPPVTLVSQVYGLLVNPARTTIVYVVLEPQGTKGEVWAMPVP